MQNHHSLWQRVCVPVVTLLIGASITTVGWLFLDWLTKHDALAELRREVLQAQKERESIRLIVERLQVSVSTIEDTAAKIEASDHWQWQNINRSQRQMEYFHGPGGDSERRTIRDWRGSDQGRMDGENGRQPDP